MAEQQTLQHTKYNFLSNSISCQQSFTLIGTNSVSSIVSVMLSLWMLPFLTYPYVYSISHYCWLLYSPISGSLLSKTSLLTFWAWQSWTFIVLSSNTWRFHLWEWNFSKERNMKTLELHHLYGHGRLHGHGSQWVWKWSLGKPYSHKNSKIFVLKIFIF